MTIDWLRTRPESPRERYEKGKRLRQRMPRDRQAEWTSASPGDHRRVAALARVDEGRLRRLLPEKTRRMRASPFAFFRGAAALMAADLSTLPSTGMTVQLCGDAHVRNLGAYASPDGRLVFDINDFDETIAGPWEWDVKRLATSIVLAGGEAGLSQARCEESVHDFVASYRRHLRIFATIGFGRLGRYLITRKRDEPLLRQIFDDAEHMTPMRNLKRLTVRDGLRFRFHDNPPTLEHVASRVAADVVRSLHAYSTTLTASRRRTFSRYRPADVAFKLVGTGSVGTRDYVVLLFGNDRDDPLFLQVKQELASCYAPYLPGRRRAAHEGRRVADGQQMMQTVSDPFLGHTQCGGYDYLVRQLADHKAAVDPMELTRRTLFEYASLCGEVLAKGHARTADAAMLAGYMGRSGKLDHAIAAFAVAYAEQTRADHGFFLRSRGVRSAARI